MPPSISARFRPCLPAGPCGLAYYADIIDSLYAG